MPETHLTLADLRELALENFLLRLDSRRLQEANTDLQKMNADLRAQLEKVSKESEPRDWFKEPWTEADVVLDSAQREEGRTVEQAGKG